MTQVRPYLLETTRALLVLALILLNLAPHATPAVAHDGFGFTAAATVFCGEGSEDKQSAHAPCHACRPGTEALLPPPPCAAVAIGRFALPVLYAVVAAETPNSVKALAHRSRGPPAQV